MRWTSEPGEPDAARAIAFRSADMSCRPQAPDAVPCEMDSSGDKRFGRYAADARHEVTPLDEAAGGCDRVIAVVGHCDLEMEMRARRAADVAFVAEIRARTHRIPLA